MHAQVGAKVERPTFDALVRRVNNLANMQRDPQQQLGNAGAGAGAGFGGAGDEGEGAGSGGLAGAQEGLVEGGGGAGGAPVGGAPGGVGWHNATLVRRPQGPTEGGSREEGGGGGGGGTPSALLQRMGELELALGGKADQVRVWCGGRGGRWCGGTRSGAWVLVLVQWAVCCCLGQSGVHCQAENCVPTSTCCVQAALDALRLQLAFATRAKQPGDAQGEDGEAAAGDGGGPAAEGGAADNAGLLAMVQELLGDKASKVGGRREWP